MYDLEEIIDILKLISKMRTITHFPVYERAIKQAISMLEDKR